MTKMLILEILLLNIMFNSVRNVGLLISKREWQIVLL
jgi:hypothetical protein